jgi:hypothetical protein
LSCGWYVRSNGVVHVCKETGACKVERLLDLVPAYLSVWSVLFSEPCLLRWEPLPSLVGWPDCPGFRHSGYPSIKLTSTNSLVNLWNSVMFVLCMRIYMYSHRSDNVKLNFNNSPILNCALFMNVEYQRPKYRVPYYRVSILPIKVR